VTEFLSDPTTLWVAILLVILLVVLTGGPKKG
jgi:hypothetical protein